MSGAPRGVRAVAQSARAATWLNGCGLNTSRLAALRCPSLPTPAPDGAGGDLVCPRHSRAKRSADPSMTAPFAPRLSDQFKNSGEIRLGRNSETFGHMMIKASTTSIGISMIIVSLIAERMLMPATEQAIIRHSP